MKDPNIVTHMTEAVAGRLNPAITRWNRLEGRPRTHDFDRALRAEVRDALWMLSRQWQMGEFQGYDAGSPVLARACIDIANIDRFQAGAGSAESFGIDVPLEATVERKPLPLRVDAQFLSLDLRLMVGRRWLKLLARERARPGGLAADYSSAFSNRYKIKLPDRNLKTDAAICAHLETWQMVNAVAERAMDGIALLEYLAIAGNHSYDGIGAGPGDEPKLEALAQKLKAWFNRLILQPPIKGSDAWMPERLEYQFGVSAQEGIAAPGGAREMVMRAKEYYQGHLDWYALEQYPGETQLGDTSVAPKAPELKVHTFLPTAIVFEGMPNTRWWEFEDRRTNFGEVRPDTTDLGKLLLLEFGLVYANDWFVLPYTLPLGTVTEVKGIAISNVFNERFWIEPVREFGGAAWERWNMFALTSDGAEQVPPPARLVMLPTTPKVQESAEIEEVALIRDEMANMVWAIERRIPLPSGYSKPGAEAARELLNFLRQPLQKELERLQKRKAVLDAIPEANRTSAEKNELAQINSEIKKRMPPDPKADIRYQVMNTVPENWIPFISVHVAASVRETQLQRAAMPRLLEGDPNPPEKVRPWTSLLRQNMPGPYFIHEEQVPRAGTLVTQSYQRTRWMGGRVFTWFGARKQTGRGEGSSGLQFDRLMDTKKRTQN